MINETDLVSFVDGYDFVLLVETFVDIVPKTLFPNHEIFICPGVRVSESIHGRLCGGVILLVKNKWEKYVERIPLELDNIIALKISRKLTNFQKDTVLIGAYLPPENSKYYKDTDMVNGVCMLEECIMDINHQYGDLPVLIFGDLNARTACRNSQIFFDPIDCIEDMMSTVNEEEREHFNERISKDLVTNAFGKYLLNVCNEFRLSIINGLKKFSYSPDFTYVSETGCSVIDLFVASHELLDHCLLFKTVPMVESKHAAIELSLKCHFTKPKDCVVPNESVFFSKYQWDCNNTESFKELIRSDQFLFMMDDAMLLIEYDVNLALEKFNECLKYAGESMLRKIHVGKKTNKKWFDKECSQCRFSLRQQLRKFNRTNTVEDRQRYTQNRREYKELIRLKKAQYKENFIDKLHGSLNDSKAFWNAIRSVRPRAGAPENISRDQWFNHFKKVFDSDAINNSNEEEVAEPEAYDYLNPNDNMLNEPILENEIISAIQSLKSNKAPGPDGLIGEFYKNGREHILPFLIKFFNYIFDNGLFPDNWSLSILQPLHKKGDINNPDNFRGISLLDICSKLYSHILNKRITAWIDKNNLIGEEQAGFRKDHSTTDHVFTLHALIQKQLIRHRKLYVAFIDFKKAFDSVSRKKLWGILRKNGVEGKMLQALRSMYDVVKTKVRCGLEFTDTFMCPQGVKQGEICSPILFSLFINELTKSIQENGRHGVQLSPDFIELLIMLFADDVALIADSVVGLQCQINTLAETANRLNLIVNLEKSNIVVFRNGGYLAANEKWVYGHNALKVVNSYKYLGIFLSTRNRFSATLEDLAKRAKKGVVAILRTLWSIGEHSPVIFFKMFDSQIQPILTYGAEVWGLTNNQEMIEKIHLFAIKRFLGVHPKAPRHLVYGESGRYPIYVITYTKCIKFWLRIMHLDNSRLSRKAYNMLLFLQQQNYTTWACAVRNILFTYGFGFVWEAQGVGNTRHFIRCFKERLIDCAKQNWHSQLASHTFYDVYHTYKKSPLLSTYLVVQKNFFVRRAMARFRIGMSEIKCHFLQYKPNQRNNSHCPFCHELPETEYHFLIICPEYQLLREEYIPRKFFRKPSAFRFCILMASPSEQLNRDISMFVYKALMLRQNKLRTQQV